MVEYNHTNSARVQAVIAEDRTPIQPVRSPAEDSLVAEVDAMLGRFGSKLDELTDALASIKKDASETSATLIKLPKQVSRWKHLALVLGVLGGGGAITNSTLSGIVDDYEATIRKQIEAEKVTKERNDRIDAWLAQASADQERFKTLEGDVQTLTKTVTTLSETVARVAAEKARKPK